MDSVLFVVSISILMFDIQIIENVVEWPVWIICWNNRNPKHSPQVIYVCVQNYVDGIYLSRLTDDWPAY